MQTIPESIPIKGSFRGGLPSAKQIPTIFPRKRTAIKAIIYEALEEHEKALVQYAKSGPKRTKAEIGYSATQSKWAKANKRLEGEFLKGLERKKGPFHWEQ